MTSHNYAIPLNISEYAELNLTYSKIREKGGKTHFCVFF